MRLSTKAWALSTPVIRAVKAHLFYQELVEGTLDMARFAYYMEQDRHYLQDFSLCNNLIARKCPPPYMSTFLQYADDVFLLEQARVHDLFKAQMNLVATRQIAPATVGYGKHLLYMARNKPVEVAIAAILPCFWVYHDLGKWMAEHTPPNNPFKPWCDLYNGTDFDESVQEAICIFDAVGARASPSIQDEMLSAFHKSAHWEKRFFDDVYHKKSLSLTHLTSEHGKSAKRGRGRGIHPDDAGKFPKMT
jgi:thiaminase/transcriptional activator TenA